jgi:hypothetical protein
MSSANEAAGGAAPCARRRHTPPVGSASPGQEMVIGVPSNFVKKNPLNGSL